MYTADQWFEIAQKLHEVQTSSKLYQTVYAQIQERKPKDVTVETISAATYRLRNTKIYNLASTARKHNKRHFHGQLAEKPKRANTLENSNTDQEDVKQCWNRVPDSQEYREKKKANQAVSARKMIKAINLYQSCNEKTSKAKLIADVPTSTTMTKSISNISINMHSVEVPQEAICAVGFRDCSMM